MSQQQVTTVAQLLARIDELQGLNQYLVGRAVALNLEVRARDTQISTLTARVDELENQPCGSAHVEP